MIASTRPTNQRTSALSVGEPGTLTAIGLPPTSLGLQPELLAAAAEGHLEPQREQLGQVHELAQARVHAEVAAVRRHLEHRLRLGKRAGPGVKVLDAVGCEQLLLQKLCMMKTSPSVWSTGVPAGKHHAPTAPACSSQVLMRMSNARLESPFGTPGRLPSMVGTLRFELVRLIDHERVDAQLIPGDDPGVVVLDAVLLLLQAIFKRQDLALDLFDRALVGARGLALVLQLFPDTPAAR